MNARTHERLRKILPTNQISPTSRQKIIYVTYNFHFLEVERWAEVAEKMALFPILVRNIRFIFNWLDNIYFVVRLF